MTEVILEWEAAEEDMNKFGLFVKSKSREPDGISNAVCGSHCNHWRSICIPIFWVKLRAEQERNWKKWLLAILDMPCIFLLLCFANFLVIEATTRYHGRTIRVQYRITTLFFSLAILKIMQGIVLFIFLIHYIYALKPIPDIPFRHFTLVFQSREYYIYLLTSFCILLLI